MGHIQDMIGRVRFNRSAIHHHTARRRQQKYDRLTKFNETSNSKATVFPTRDPESLAAYRDKLLQERKRKYMVLGIIVLSTLTGILTLIQFLSSLIPVG